MFYYVLQCLVSRATIGDCAAADRLRDRDNATGIGDNTAGISDNSAEIGNNAAGIGNIHKSDPMLNSVLNGDWSNCFW